MSGKWGFNYGLPIGISLFKRHTRRHKLKSTGTQRIVLVAEDSSPQTILDKNSWKLRSANMQYVSRIREIGHAAGYSVIHYRDPEELISHAAEHRADVVISFWHGSGSRNQVALIPAICEAYNIAYIGADTQARVLCEDKFLTRCFARNLGFKIADGVIVRAKEELANISLPNPPVVLKPLWGGMSQGVSLHVSNDSRCTVKQAIEDLMLVVHQPVVVERFCPGREIMVVMVGMPDNISVFEVCEVVCLTDDRFFFTRIFDSDLKQSMSSKDWCLRRVTDEVGPHVHSLCKAAFKALGQIHVVRFDGRWDGKHFWLLEITPTPNLQALGALLTAGKWNELDAPAIVRTLVELANHRSTLRFVNG